MPCRVSRPNVGSEQHCFGPAAPQSNVALTPPGPSEFNPTPSGAPGVRSVLAKKHVSERARGHHWERWAKFCGGGLVHVTSSSHQESRHFPNYIDKDNVDQDRDFDNSKGQIGVVRFDRKDRRPINMVNFGCHALARWDQRGNISADYPGVLCAALDSQGIDALFIQGALGNVHPVREGEEPSARIGTSLAEDVLRISRDIAPSDNTDLKLYSRTIETGRLPVLDEDEAKRRWEEDPR